MTFEEKKASCYIGIGMVAGFLLGYILLPATHELGAKPEVKPNFTTNMVIGVGVSDGEIKSLQQRKTAIIENCEYWGFRGMYDMYFYTHKGNCTNSIHTWRGKR